MAERIYFSGGFPRTASSIWPSHDHANRNIRTVQVPREASPMISQRTIGRPRQGGEEHLQGDLFTGEWQAKPPKRGNGSHIRLKPVDGEKPVVPGIASYAGEGPKGKYCEDCDYFGEVAVQRTPDTIEKNPAGCALWAQRMRHAAPVPRRDIRLCPSCKYFEPADGAPRRFFVDQAGVWRRA